MNQYPKSSLHASWTVPGGLCRNFRFLDLPKTPLFPPGMRPFVSTAIVQSETNFVRCFLLVMQSCKNTYGIREPPLAMFMWKNLSREPFNGQKCVCVASSEQNLIHDHCALQTQRQKKIIYRNLLKETHLYMQNQ